MACTAVNGLRTRQNNGAKVAKGNVIVTCKNESAADIDKECLNKLNRE